MTEQREQGRLKVGVDALSAELDDYDLLNSTVSPASQAAKSAPLPDANLAATAQAFHSRIERLKREQEKVLSEEEQKTQSRHELMMKALLNIRRSLTDVTRIDLGKRFRFRLLKDDWQGWPRITIVLCDSTLSEAVYPLLQVTAHDRKSRGIIEIAYHPDRKPEWVSLAQENESSRLPSTLKRCVRAYLDLVGEIILEAGRKRKPLKSGDEADAKYLKAKNSAEFEETGRKKPETHITGDLFEEEFGKNDFLETLPSLEELDQLAEIAEVAGQKKARVDE